MPRSTLEVEGHRDGRRGVYFRRETFALLPKPLQQHVPAKRNARDDQWPRWVIAHDAPNDEVEVRRLAGVIEPGRAWHFAIAPAKDQNVGSPPTPPRLVEQAA
jgi:hypothetical protein